MYNDRKYSKIPFLLIVVLSVVLILFILYTRNQSDNSIHQLQKSSNEALKIFKANKLIDEVFNQLYVVNSIASSDNTAKRIIDSLPLLTSKVNELDTLFKGTALAPKASDFCSLVKKQVSFYQQVAANSNVPNTGNQQLSDSLFVAAVNLEEQLGQYLQNNISGNERLANNVLKTDVLLTILIIVLIAVLASIILRFLTSNFKLIKAIEQQREQIAQTAKVKDQFLANMSHEIRTPINSVIGFTNLLHKTTLKDNQKTYVGIIKTAGENLLSIVNDILDFSKIEAGMMYFDNSPFSIEEVCYQLETMLYLKASEKGLDLTFKIDNNVPEIVAGDKERLMQILLNLVSNAIKFTNKGSINIHVALVNQSKADARIVFSVTDTGIGIPPELLDKIFQRFEQAEADTTRKFGGTGLGLAIVKNLVEMQGGVIAVNSEEGKGTVFSFELNFQTNKESWPETMIATSTTKQNAAVGKLTMPTSKLRVLAAEDNAMNKLLLQSIFEQWKISITIVDNDEVAIGELSNAEYDLVLMDIQMPVMDGYTAIKKIRKELQLSVPVIAMTANVLPGEKEKCADAGMNGYISKPINEDELFGLLKMFDERLLRVNDKADLQNEPYVYIRPSYIERVFGKDEGGLKAFLFEFEDQLNEELDEFNQLFKAKNDVLQMKRKAHHLKSTIGVLSDKSPLFPLLTKMEAVPVDADIWPGATNDFNDLQKRILVLKEELSNYRQRF